ncbi:P-loop containing nucleoside triphosphate hydrolase [Phytophthora cactorum]|nr:P-loop containing nucleoside triphosphate hydrolase [Phytophthora cactorum]
MPKFVFEDVPLFHGLINDLFPGLDCPRVGYAALKDAIEAELIAGEYNTTNTAVYNEQIDKIIQMYETMLVRHTTMIVGPTEGWQDAGIEHARSRVQDCSRRASQVFVLNPKAHRLQSVRHDGPSHA